MSDTDTDIQVSFGAQIQGLLDGMGSAQDAVKEATEGMSGSISRMAETMEKLGPAALALAGVGLAFEGIKASIEYVNESVEATAALALSFRTMENATGATNAEMNMYTGAMVLAGGTTGDLTNLMNGMVRSIKAHSDVLIANGVATDKASLQSMGFGEYLNKVMDIADRMGSPIREGLQGLSGDGDNRNQSRRVNEEQIGSASASRESGSWSDYELLQCLDGKARRTKSGLFPLAHGVSNRVVKLRGSGNAIVPQAAAKFIEACEEFIVAR